MNEICELNFNDFKNVCESDWNTTFKAQLKAVPASAVPSEPYSDPNFLLQNDDTPDILVPGLEIAAGTIYVSGAGPNVGKTWKLLQISMSLATGTPFWWDLNPKSQLPGYNQEIQDATPRTPQHVIHIDKECGAGEVRSKCIRMINYIARTYKVPEDCRLSMLQLANTYYHYYDTDSLPKYSKDSSSKFISEFQNILTRTYVGYDGKKEQAKIVMIDHLAGLNGGDENNNSEMADLTNVIRILAIKHGVGMTVEHHTNKVSNKPSANNKTVDMNCLRGASAIAGGFTGGVFFTNEGTYIKAHIIKTPYYGFVNDISFRMVDTGDDADYPNFRKNHRNKSPEFHLESTAGILGVPAEKVKLTGRDVKLVIKNSPLRTKSEIYAKLRERKVPFSDAEASALIDALIVSKDVFQTQDPNHKQKKIFSINDHGWDE